MLPQQIIRGALTRAFTRRPDRSLGWADLESRQAAALGRAIGRSFSLPPELLPFPAPARRRVGVVAVLKRILAWGIALQLCYLLATSILIALYRYVDPPVTVLMAYRKWRFGWDVKAPRPVALRKVPRYIRSMLVAVEDGKFYEHHGLDYEAFERAREINKRLGKPLYGGSTLTMQVARTLFLVPEKSYIRKYLEVLTALELEALLPKERILELYFGYAEWGKGIFGIEAASRKWYGRGISALTRDESARLLAILSSPVKYGPYTLQRNGILRERYRYLSARFDPPAEAALPTDAAAEPPPSAPRPSGAGISATTDLPPPSPEPGSEAEADNAAEAPQPN
jgi:monofunctional biosynthetic peptidoglycan transglycosylase